MFLGVVSYYPFQTRQIKMKEATEKMKSAAILLLAYQTKLINYLEESLSNSNNHWVKNCSDL